MPFLRRFLVRVAISGVTGPVGLVGLAVVMGLAGLASVPACVESGAGAQYRYPGASGGASSSGRSGKDSSGNAGAEGGPCRAVSASSRNDQRCDRLLRCHEPSNRCVIDETIGTAYGPCYPNGTCNGTLVCDVDIDTCAPPPALGSDGGPCYGNGTCDGYLACVDGRCAVSGKSGE